VASETTARFLDLRPAQKVALQRVRAVVGGLAPDAEEGTSYGVPAFILAGRPLFVHCDSAPDRPGT
jgi:uncharacterized protein YdhG (YjbR/CyaY superfamily)